MNTATATQLNIEVIEQNIKFWSDWKDEKLDVLIKIKDRPELESEASAITRSIDKADKRIAIYQEELKAHYELLDDQKNGRQYTERV